MMDYAKINVIDDMCIKCDSDIDPSYSDNPNRRDAFNCSGGCYFQITDDSRVIRGCVEELSSDEEKNECRCQSF